MIKHNRPKHRATTSSSSSSGLLGSCSSQALGGGKKKKDAQKNKKKCDNDCKKKKGAAKKKCVADCLKKVNSKSKSKAKSKSKSKAGGSGSGSSSSSATGVTSGGGLHTEWDLGNPGVGVPATAGKFNIVCPRTLSAYVVIANILGQVCSAIQLETLTLVLCESVGEPGKFVFAVSVFSTHHTFAVRVDLDEGIALVGLRSNAGLNAGLGSWQSHHLLPGTGNDLTPVNTIDVINALKAAAPLFNQSVMTSVTVQPMQVGNPGLKGADYYACQSLNLHLIDDSSNELKCTFNAGTGRTEISNPQSTPFYAEATFGSCPCLIFSDQQPQVDTLGYTGGADLKAIYDSILALPNPLAAHLGTKPGWGWRFFYTATQA